MKERYFENFKQQWIPTYKRQVFKAKVNNDTEALLNIQLNIWENWNLNENQKKELLKELGLSKIR